MKWTYVMVCTTLLNVSCPFTQSNGYWCWYAFGMKFVKPLIHLDFAYMSKGRAEMAINNFLKHKVMLINFVIIRYLGLW